MPESEMASSVFLFNQAGAAVEIPANHEYGRTRLDESLAQCAVITRGIDQHGRSVGSCETPDVALGTEDHVWLLADAALPPSPNA